MKNTELTLEQLSEVAGGAPHITTWYRNKIQTENQIFGQVEALQVFGHQVVQLL